MQKKLLEKIVLSNKENEITNKINDLLKDLSSEIKNYVNTYNWDIYTGLNGTQINIDEKGNLRGRIFVRKKDLKNNKTQNNHYEIGIEHFNPNTIENKQKRDDYIFCGRFHRYKNNSGKWSGKKNITNYKGVEMRTNSDDYIGLLLTEKKEDLASHFLEEFKTYFNNNKY